MMIIKIIIPEILTITIETAKKNNSFMLWVLKIITAAVEIISKN